MTTCHVCRQEVMTDKVAYWINGCTVALHPHCGDSVHTFVKISYDGSSCVVTPDEARDFADGDDGELKYETIQMTWAEYVSLPDFTGF